MTESCAPSLDRERAFLQLAATPDTVFLDTADADGRQGGTSILATEPLLTLTDEAAWTALAQEPVDADVTIPWELPFAGGWIGYFAYEAYEAWLSQVASRPTRYPTCRFGFYDTFLCFDHASGAVTVASLGLSDPAAESDEGLARKKIADLKRRLDGRGASVWAPGQTRRSAPTDIIKPVIPKKTYHEHLAAIQDYIRAGDCYQINYTQSFQTYTSVTPERLYQRLRRTSPAPWAAYLNAGDFQILSASPESFLEIRGDRVRTCPIKGTRRRDPVPAEDAHLREELLTSPKDRAELLMITDLERNDLGKVCQAGSVATTQLIGLQTLPQVYHLYSVIEGRLRPGIRPWDVLAACFPGGSVTGAPKLRAMQIIRELEPHPREVYTGAIGYISVDGQSRFNIPIRTLLYARGDVTLYAGGGIVADSDPEAEYEECWVKTQGIREAL